MLSQQSDDYKAAIIIYRMLNVVATAAASCELSSGGEENTNKANLTNSVPAFSSKLKKNYKNCPSIYRKNLPQMRQKQESLVALQVNLQANRKAIMNKNINGGGW